MLPRKRLGRTDTDLAPIGVGIWSWGDRRFWQYDPVNGFEDCREAFEASTGADTILFDTAEMYGSGESERILGTLIKETGRRVFVATKFAPWPNRLTTASVARALDRSLVRLQLDRVDLYQIHFPYTLLSMKGLMRRLADAVDAGKTRTVGVSNFSARQLRLTHALLAARGIPLVSNQVEYSLLERAPESNGVLSACRDLEVTLMAYSPLALGVLTGKYKPGQANVGGARRFTRHFRKLREAQPVLDCLDQLGHKYDRTPSQIALNWLARDPDVLPIPGARNGRQARENAAAAEFLLSEDDWRLLDEVSRPWCK